MKKIAIVSVIKRWDEKVPICLNSIESQTYTNWIHIILVSEESKLDIENYLVKKLGEEGFNNKIIIKLVDDYLTWGSRKNILITNGDYIFNIDGDDYLAPDCLEKLVTTIEETGADIACCGVARYFEKNKELDIYFGYDETKVLEHKDYHEFLIPYDRTMDTFWGKLFRSNLFDLVDFSHIPPPEQRGGFGGDTMMSFAMLEKSKKIVILKGIGYYYRIWDVSASNKFLPNREKVNGYMYECHKRFLLSLSPEISPENLSYIIGGSNYRIYITIQTLINSDLTNNEKFQKFYNLLIEDASKETLPDAGISILGYILNVFIRFLEIFNKDKDLIDVNTNFERQSIDIFIMLFDYIKQVNDEFKRALFLLINISNITNIDEIKELLQLVAHDTKFALIASTFDMFKKDSQLLKALVTNDKNELKTMLATKLEFDTLNEELLDILINLSDSDNLINTIDNIDFWLHNKNITENLINLKLEYVFELMTDSIMSGEKIDMFEDYINLYINLSSKLEIELGFLVGKLKLAKFLYENNKLENSLTIAKELVEIGFVSDELDCLIENLNNNNSIK